MTHPRLKEIEERLAKATPGPWRKGQWADGTQHEEQWNVFAPGSQLTIVVDTIKSDAELIARAPEDLALCLRVIEEMRAALEFYASPWGAHHGFDDCSNTAITKVLNEQTVTARQALARVDELCGGEE